MRLLLSDVMAITSLPFVASATQGYSIVEIPQQVNWVRQIQRTEVLGSETGYSTRFSLGSSEYVLKGEFPNGNNTDNQCTITRYDSGASAEFSKLTSSASFDVDAPRGSEFSRYTSIQKAQTADTLTDAIVRDAMKFKAMLSDVAWKPKVWADEGEIVFEWIKDGRHAVVSLEGDGLLGYTMLVDGKFVSGAVIRADVSSLPGDLLDYLTLSA